jgi:hypothetical protein
MQFYWEIKTAIAKIHPEISSESPQAAKNAF